MKKENYYAEVNCKNCSYGYPDDDGFEISKGKTEKEWSSETECPECGCKNVLYFRKTFPEKPRYI